MKKITLLIGTSVLALCLVILSCRKEINSYIEDPRDISSQVLESSKIFYEKNATMTDGLIEAKQKKLFKHPVSFWRPKFIRLKPLWKQAKQVSGNGRNMVIVPTIENRLATRKVSIRRFFVFDIAAGRPKNGEIVEILGLEFDVSSKVDELIANYDQESIPGFSGAIIRYDLNYQLKVSSLYKAGQKSTRKGMITRELASKASSNGIKQPSTNASLASSSDSGGGTGGSGTTTTQDGPCTLFYFYQYEMDAYGNITSETYTYLYSTGNCSGGNTGGTGGSNPGSSDPGSSDNGGTGGTNTDFTPGGGGGDYGGNVTASVALTALGKSGATLCGYYHNKKVGSGYTGGISNLGFELTVVYQYGNGTVTIPVVIPDGCFQIGYLGTNEAVASTVFVNAYNAAVQELAYMIQYNVISAPNHNQPFLTSTLAGLISANLAVLPGFNSFIPGPCLGAIPVTTATYNCY